MLSSTLAVHTTSCVTGAFFHLTLRKPFLWALRIVAHWRPLVLVTAFRYPYRGRHVVFTLRGCLYAPGAPINLLSVGALVERGMSCLFFLGGITKVFYPESHPGLPGFVFSATVANLLSFLNLDFLSPAVSISPSAFPAHALVPSSPTPSALSFLALSKTLSFGIVALVISAWMLLVLP